MSTAVNTRFRPLAAEQSLDISERVCPMQYETSELSTAATSRLKGCQINGISLVHYESRGLEHGTRTIEHVRANPFDFFILCLPLHARFQFFHSGFESNFADGEAVLLTAQRPFDAYISGPDPDGWHASLEVRVPGALLRSRVPRVDLYCNQAFSVRTVVGVALRSVLLETLNEAQQLTEAQARHVSRAVTELIAGCLSEFDGRRMSAPEPANSADVIFKRATAYIESQLSAVDLSAELVAKHCHVSASYLHKIFAKRTLTVAGFVREMRLQCCREAIRDSRMADRSIFEIACRWGFADPSHFGRVYRKRFGVSPKEDRIVENVPTVS